jgi:hypothetical protein
MCNVGMNRLIPALAVLMLFVGGCQYLHPEVQAPNATPPPSPTPQLTAAQELARAHHYVERAVTEANSRNYRGALELVDIASSSLFNAGAISGAEKASAGLALARKSIEKKDKKAAEALDKVAQSIMELAQKGVAEEKK